MWLFGVMSFYTALNTFEYVNLYSLEKYYDTAPEWRFTVLATIIPFDYFSISLGLSIASVNLLVHMKRHFSKGLRAESRRIKVVFTVLTLSYISRATVYVLARPKFGIIDNYRIVYNVMYTFWDIVPLSLIMVYHYRAFKTEDAQDERQSTDLTCASSNSVPSTLLRSVPDSRPVSTISTE